MKGFYVLTFFLALTAVNAETYSSENDDFDINAAVADVESLKALVGCFLGTKDCNAVAADFKKDIPEATLTACAKCTQAQKNIYHVFLQGLKDKLPEDFEAFKNKFDPDGTHFTSLEAAVGN